jgi:hypothetical protein
VPHGNGPGGNWRDGRWPREAESHYAPIASDLDGLRDADDELRRVTEGGNDPVRQLGTLGAGITFIEVCLDEPALPDPVPLPEVGAMMRWSSRMAIAGLALIGSRTRSNREPGFRWSSGKCRLKGVLTILTDLIHRRRNWTIRTAGPLSGRRVA